MEKYVVLNVEGNSLKASIRSESAPLMAETAFELQNVSPIQDGRKYLYQI